MKISKMTTGSWGKIVAFFSIETSEGLIVTGFKLINGSSGKFIGFPSKQEKDGEYKDTIYAKKELKDKITLLAINHYDTKDEIGVPI